MATTVSNSITNFSFTEEISQRAQIFDDYLNHEWADHIGTAIKSTGLEHLASSINYSLFSGGKRFRPLLCLFTAEALGQRHEDVLPYAVAIECIHTYSLIHDDLPCMDDDDVRRGKPTNHKVYGQATALLAGDALASEAFSFAIQRYASVIDSQRLVLAIKELSHAIGFHGMVGGQAIDLESQTSGVELEELTQMHKMKTGALIRSAVLGTAHLCGGTAKQIENLKTYSENLGLAFQVADDILDHTEDQPERGSFPSLLGLNKTSEYLKHLSEQAHFALKDWNENAKYLRALVEYNLNRTA